MRNIRIWLALFTLATMASAQKQPPKPSQDQRDLKIEPARPDPVPPKGVPIPPRSYAVVIGISRYPTLPAQSQLHYAERDAQTIFTTLINPEGGAFKAENVHLLTDDKATLKAIRYEIGTWLPSQAQAGDRVVIYFAGHGFIDRGTGKGYLAPSDIDVKRVAETGFPMEELGATFSGKIHAKDKILFADACHSGAIFPAGSQDAVNGALANLNSSVFSFTASRDREVSYESDQLQHGLFTYYLWKGMEGAADADHDGVVTADELGVYVRSQARSDTEGKQNPNASRGSFDPQMAISYPLGGAAPGVPPPSQYGTLVFESNMDDVEVFLDGAQVGVVSKAKPLNSPGLPPGEHTVKAVHMGYEPDGPRQVTVYPGQTSTVSIRIQIPRRRQKAAEDLLDEGVKLYRNKRGSAQDYRKAAALFEKALQIDPAYSQAAYYLGETYNALFEDEKAKEYFKKAIDIDPDYLEAHADYGGMLLDLGDADEAIRQLNIVLQRDRKNARAHTQMSQAYRMKGLYDQSIDEARQAIQLQPNYAEPHLWMADSLRLNRKLADAAVEYDRYLKLSDLDSHLAGQLNYWVLGFTIGIGGKLGSRKVAAQHDIWKEMHSHAYLGLCDTERQLRNYSSAIVYCQKALTYDPKDAYTHYALGLCYMHQAIETGDEARLTPAVRHFQQMLALNPDMEESNFARQNIAQIQKNYPATQRQP